VSPTVPVVCMYVSSFISKNMACQNASIYKEIKGIKPVCIISRLRAIANVHIGS